jgi:beta-N-acetylhexosaminidase
MKALSGSAGDKAAGAIAAGCDLVLDCWARMDEMVEIATRLPDIAPRAAERLARAMGSVGRPSGDFDALIDTRDRLLALSSAA